MQVQVTIRWSEYNQWNNSSNPVEGQDIENGVKPPASRDSKSGATKKKLPTAYY